jgi:hypothetical protein
MGAFLGPLIGLGAGAIGSAFGGTNPLTGLSPGVSNASQSILGNIPTQISKGNAATDQGLGNLGAAGNFFKTILGGSLEATQKLLAPQTNTILKQYDNAAKTAANLGPRGGGKVSTLVGNESAKTGAYGSALGGVLPGAAEGLAGVGKNQAGIGTNLTGQANETLGPIMRQQDQAAATNAQNFGGLGSGLGKWLAGLMTNKGSASGGGGGDFSGGLDNSTGGITG